MTEPYLDTKQVAQLLGCTEAALALWRKERRGPPFTRIGKLVRYGASELSEWLEDRTERSGSESGPVAA